jgi:hypothetical protein
MRSIKEYIKVIKSVDGLIVGNWYNLYYNGENRLLFKYKGSIGSIVYDSGCYKYWCNQYDNTNDMTFSFEDMNYHCESVKKIVVKKYFPYGD